jgi:hypothetical protein
MKINVNDTKKISAALEAVNGRATAHTLTSCDVWALAERAEKDLQSRGVSKKAMKGTRVTYTPAGPGKAYARKARYVVSTLVTIERGSSGWFLTEAERNEIWADSPERLVIHVTAEARQAIMARAFANIAD